MSLAGIARREPYRRLARLHEGILAKGGRRDDAAVSLAELTSPVRARDVADVGDRLAAKLRRARHAPSRNDEFALTMHAVAHNRRMVWS
jgi:hypothetical protein